LHDAKLNKNDEFYTRMTDIEKELSHYDKYFKDKKVFCNCDDPSYSNFVRYFALNFEFLGIKKLISTHYENDIPSYKIEIEHKIEDINEFDNVEHLYLAENGDFRSPESIELLKKSDVVVTNPPFSLFRKYVAQLIEYKKKFLIVGSYNAVTYKEIFPLIKDNKIWIGHNSIKEFTAYNGETKKFGNIIWYTNITHKKRNEKLTLFRNYYGNEISYPKYDNYDAIEVNKVADIPKDYYGVMGVPITFLDKYNPKQFEILGDSRYITGECNDINIINGVIKYRRIMIKRKDGK